MTEHKYKCKTCNYSTNHAGMWKRHCESSKHAKLALQMVCANGDNGAKKKTDIDAILKQNLIMGRTLHQLKDTLLDREKELYNLREEVVELRKRLSEKKKGASAKVMNNTNNTFIFLVDDTTLNNDKIDEFVKQFESRISHLPHTQSDKTDVVVLNVGDTMPNIKMNGNQIIDCD